MSEPTTPTQPVAADPAVAATPATPAPAADQAAKPASDPATTADPAKKAAEAAPKDTAQLLFGEDPEDKAAADAAKKEGEDGKDPEKDGDKKPADGEAIKFEDFKIAEGYAVAPEVQTKLTDVLNNPDLSQKDKVQAMLDLHTDIVKQVADEQLEGFAKVREGWRNEAKNDPVIGGDKLPAAIKAANAAVLALAKDPKFGGDEGLHKNLVSYLTQIGMGDNPHMIRFLGNINTLIAKTKDDTLDAGGGGGGAEPKAIENILWGTPQK